MLIGFSLFVSSCGFDACEALPVSERIYPTELQCQQMLDRVQARCPAAVLMCGEVYRDEDGGDGNQSASD
ncbi:hypothetical protein I5Q16_16840 [Serratia marcescens]|nr:hypothetical protein [Serratia marcescens]